MENLLLLRSYMESNGRGTELKGKEEGENTKVRNLKKKIEDDV